MAVSRYLPLAAIVLGCSLANAQPVAKIDGPKTEQAGNLVVLNSVATKGDAKKWIVPTALENRYIQTEHQVAFSVRENGDYRFAMVAVDVMEGESVEIDVVTHVVKITDGLCNPNPPVDPVDPEPEPVPVPSKIREVSRDAAIELNDPVTAESLAKALAQIEQESIDLMSAKTQAATEAVLLIRKGPSLDKDWLNVWRRPVEAEMRSTEPRGRKSELDAIAIGLKDSLDSGDPEPQHPPTPIADPVPDAKSVIVVMYSRKNCSWCEKWNREVRPTLLAWGFGIKDEKGNEAVPTFKVVEKDGTTEVVVGYRDESWFKKFL
jgi:hypothetical protein